MTYRRHRRHAARLFSVVLAAAAAVPVLAGCGTSAASPPGSGSRDMVVAAVPATGAAALYIAEDRGLFARAGLHVTVQSSVSAADVVADLVHGSVNVSLGQWTSAIAAEVGGVRLRAVASGNSGGTGLEELVTSPGSGVTRLSQLKGKTIAVNALSGLSQILTESVLSSAGVAGGQVRWTVIPFPDMAAALAAHRVAAAFMIQPYLASSGKTVTELADIDSGTTTGFPITGYVTSMSWAQQNPATLAAFTAALAQGQRIAASDPAAVAQAVARYAGIKVPAGMPLGGFPAGVSVPDLERVAELMQRYGLLPATASARELAEEMTP